MKRKILVITMITMITMMALASCGKKKHKNDKQNFSKEMESYLSETEEEAPTSSDNDIVNHTSYGSDYSECIYNDDGTCSIDYTIDNGDVDVELGVYLFINGDMQKYTTENNNECLFMHCFDVEKKTKKTFKLTFNPIVSKKSEKFYIRVCNILNPNTIPDSKYFQYGINTYITDGFPKKISNKNVKVVEKKVSIYKSTEMSEDKIKEYQYTDDRGNFKDKLSSARFELVEINEEYTNWLKINKDSISCNLRAMGGMKSNYNIYAFINNRCINEDDAVEFDLEGETSEINETIEMNFSSMIDECSINKYNSFSVIACPKDGEEFNSICKTNSVIAMK